MKRLYVRSGQCPDKRFQPLMALSPTRLLSLYFGMANINGHRTRNPPIAVGRFCQPLKPPAVRIQIFHPLPAEVRQHALPISQSQDQFTRR